MIQVFYDGKCGLCRKEINYYKSIAPPGVFDWQDITLCQKQLQQTGVSYPDALKILHARRTDGKLQLGVDAFILIWKQLKYWRILAFIVAIPGLKHTAQFVYRAFALWRFKRLAHCQLALKEEQEQ